MLNWECYEILVSIALLVVSQYMSWNANLGRESLEPKKMDTFEYEKLLILS